MSMFRLWCKNKNEWEKDAWCVMPDGIVMDLRRRMPLSPKTHILIQFTGLKDKNGKEIYEGDILMPRLVNNVVNDKSPTYVIFNDGAFCIGTGMKQSLYQRYAQMYEIIGNIHEHPELLEVNK